MNKAFFTVVMPLYNKEISVTRAVSSVLSQTFTYLVLIVVDDGSTDRGADVVSKLGDSRLKLIKQVNKGPSAARNRGLSLAETEYICFLDADDSWDPNFLETMYSLIESASSASMYAVKYRETDENGRIFHHPDIYPIDYMGYVDDFYKAYINRGLVSSSSVCVTCKSLRILGGFPEHARIGEDIYTWLRLADMNRVAYAGAERVTIYRNSENRSELNLKQDIPYHIIKILNDAAIEFNIQNRNSVIDFVCRNTVVHAAGAVLRGDRRTAMEMATLLWNISRKRSGQVACVSIMPKFVLSLLKKLRN